MPNVYDFRSGRSIKNANPQRIGEELERIRSEKGKLVPEDVVEEARNPESSLHTGFTWNDSEAAHQHRLQQARRLITSIRVLNGPSAKPMTAFVSVRTPEVGRNYLPTAEAMSQEELRVRVLAEARQMIEALERRYVHFVEIGELLSNLKKAVG